MEKELVPDKLLITFKCAGCNQMVSFYATKEEVTTAKIFPVPVVIHHGDHSLVVYLDRKLGIREVEVGRHVETLMDHILGFVNETGLTKDIDMYDYGKDVGKQISEYMIKELNKGKRYSFDYFIETLTTQLKTSFSGGKIEYENKEGVVTFKVTDSPFTRTLIGEGKKNPCAFLSGIFAGSFTHGISPKEQYEVLKPKCGIDLGKNYSKFVVKKKE